MAALLAIAGVALADIAQVAPRRIAVVNTAQDQEAGAELAIRLRTVLALEPTVTPIPPGDLARALEGALPPPAVADLASVADLLARAREAMAQFDYQSSLSHLSQAEQDLLAAWPSPESARLLAETALERGRILMRQRQRERAVQEFVLVHRLDPGRQLQPERYLPDVIEAFAEAVARAGAQEADTARSVALEVTALLDGAAVYLDGRFAGYTPLTARVTPGAHYVSGTFAGQAAGGQRVAVDTARGQVAVKLGLGAITVDERALHWRHGFVVGYGGHGAAPGPDAPRREPAPLDRGLATELGRGATDFTGADAALVIATGVDGGLHVASYDARTRVPGDWTPASEHGIEQVLRPFADTDTNTQLLSAPSLSPGVSAGLLADSSGERDGRPWHRRPFYRALVNSGIAVSVAAVVFYAVLQGSNTIGGTCCTLGTVNRHGSPSLGFSF
ncbi:MAG TPA: PEGA domain-containing protein [Haliangium sp.]|nr:PEGA domain-containing protein [Haliangium sp.]